MFGEDVNQGDGRIFHIGGQTFDQSKDEVVEDLENHGDDETADRSDKGHLHTTCNDVRGDVTSLLDIIESLDHTDDRTEETEGRGDSDEQGDPGEAFLEEADLDGAIGGDVRSTTSTP